MLSNSKIYELAGLTYDGCWFGMTEEDFKEHFPDEYRKGEIARLDAEISQLIAKGLKEESEHRMTKRTRKRPKRPKVL